jgi:hypothetical protein
MSFNAQPAAASRGMRPTAEAPNAGGERVGILRLDTEAGAGWALNDSLATALRGRAPGE